MKRIREEVSAALTKAAGEMKRQYDKHRAMRPEYKEGDKVWLEGTNITTDRPMKKLGDKRFGPFKVLKKVGASSYKINIPKKWKNIHDVFNEELLTPYHKPSFPTQPRNTEPPPDVVGGELEWEVEEVVDSRKGEGDVVYKVKWKGYGPHEMTWEPPRNLTNAKDAVADFHKRHPDKPKARTLRRIEIPITDFPTHLFRPMPEPLTEPT